MSTILGISVPAKFIRASQAGDWRILKEHEVWGCSIEMKDWRSEVAVIIHEVMEALLCQRDGITDEEVTEFDYLFEAEREKGMHTEDAEAGDDPRAPYLDQHAKATEVEAAVCVALGLLWLDHEKNVNDALK